MPIPQRRSYSCTWSCFRWSMVELELNGTIQDRMGEWARSPSRCQMGLQLQLLNLVPSTDADRCSPKLNAPARQPVLQDYLVLLAKERGDGPCPCRDHVVRDVHNHKGQGNRLLSCALKSENM